MTDDTMTSVGRGWARTQLGLCGYAGFGASDMNSLVSLWVEFWSEFEQQVLD